MSENTAVRESFPHTGIAKPTPKKQPFVDYYQQSVCKMNRWAPYIEDAACAKVFELSGKSYALKEFSSRNRSDFHKRPRKWVWWILRYHPSLNVSWTAIGERYKRDHSTVLYTTKTYSSQLRSGFYATDIEAIQSLCDALEDRGLPALNVREELAR